MFHHIAVFAIDSIVSFASTQFKYLVESMRFNEVAPYISRHDEYWQSIGFMMNITAYDALDDETRAELARLSPGSV